jgi:D-aspartate ligase
LGEVLVQELIEGGGEAQFSFAALCEDGEPLAHLVARRTRQYPIDFGHSSTFVEVVEDDAVEGSARRLLRELRLTGLVEVEFKRNARDGRDALLDINPRLWTWHALGREAGVDLVYLAWLYFTGREVLKTAARVGAAWMRLAADGPAALAEIRAGRLSPRDYARSLLRPKNRVVAHRWDPIPPARDRAASGRG